MCVDFGPYSWCSGLIPSTVLRRALVLFGGPYVMPKDMNQGWWDTNTLTLVFSLQPPFTEL